LQGTEEYGNSTDNKAAWAVKFDYDKFQSFKVESPDKTYSNEYTKAELSG